MQDAKGNRYDYTSAGFNGFLSRSIDNRQADTLTGADHNAATTQGLALDRANVSGSLPDIFKVGGISFDGPQEKIILSDGETNRLLIGRGEF